MATRNCLFSRRTMMPPGKSPGTAFHQPIRLSISRTGFYLPGPQESRGRTLLDTKSSTIGRFRFSNIETLCHTLLFKRENITRKLANSLPCPSFGFRNGVGRHLRAHETGNGRGRFWPRRENDDSRPPLRQVRKSDRCVHNPIPHSHLPWGPNTIRCPAERLAEVGVGVWGVHHGGFASTVKLWCLDNIGDRLLLCGEWRGKASGLQPEGQAGVERTYKHLVELAAPVSTRKLLIN